ncbi:hypothetical protein KW842_18745 [Duganella sp. sic0402]|jgi:hypothetical protein|uniref:hypothetical protein n=1 Tax=Duganella sp. sic0402 TaxID=2854786 RepID=UPI001C468459|nr:hypothetical protein [Duganella sp. sic0402]MBV7537811.1 hypothetical protein [Duganella sp. sic0402]
MQPCDLIGLINNTLQALLNEPEDDPSGPEDVDTLVRVVSQLMFGREQSTERAQDCALAADTVRALLSS